MNSKLFSFLGGFCNDPDSVQWFIGNLNGAVSSSNNTTVLKEVWKIEKCNDQIIPVQLESRRANSTQPFDQVQLKDICILLTTDTVFLWHSFSTPDENINQGYFKNMLKNAKSIAARLSQGL